MIFSASAQVESILVILTVICSPTLAFGTKTGKPLTAAIPSPRGVVSDISTSYVLPTSTGQLPLPRLFLAFLGLRFLGLIGQLAPD
jgi:hypothetical protein